MDFEFTDEQKALARTLKYFAQYELLPNYAHWDRTGEFPEKIWNKLASLGLFGMTIPLEYGGQDADCVTVGVAAEELAKGDPNVAGFLLPPEIACILLVNNGSEQAKKQWLGPIVAGEKKPALALTEPHCGTDAAAIRCRAIRKGDRYILNGEKSASSLMKFADVVMVFAKTDPTAGARGVTAFLVPVDLPGVARQFYEDMGARCLARGSLFLDNVEISEENRLGAEGEGFKLVMKIFDFSRVILALLCIGAAEKSVEETIAYVRQRTAFGVPIAKFEAVSFALAEHYSKIETVRWMCYRALWLRDRGLPNSKEAAICKWMGPRYAVEALHRCLLLHGHYGYTKEFPFEQRLRDIMGIEIADGTEELSKIIISREILGKEYLPY